MGWLVRPVSCHVSHPVTGGSLARKCSASSVRWGLAVSLKKLVQTLRPLRTVTIDIDGHTLTAKPHLTDDAEHILAKLPPVTG